MYDFRLELLDNMSQYWNTNVIPLELKSIPGPLQVDNLNFNLQILIHFKCMGNFSHTFEMIPGIISNDTRDHLKCMRIFLIHFKCMARAVFGGGDMNE